MYTYLSEKQWITSNGLHGLVIMANNSRESFRCGYVGVPKEHKLYGLDYSEDISIEKEPHGGITFSGQLDKALVGDIDLWYIGFDCHSYKDTLEICTLYFCINECEKLALQLKELDPIAYSCGMSDYYNYVCDEYYCEDME